jgi:hypothetical protein
MAHAITHPTTDRATIDVHQITDWKAAAFAGLIGGAVFMMAEMLMVWALMGQSPWAPPRMIAAMVLGRGVLPPPADFAAVPVMTAMVIHFALSVAYGLAIGWLVHRFDMGKALLIGLAFGIVAIYGVNFYLIAPAAFPWFQDARNWISLVTHALFGVVAAAAYVGLRKPRA